MEGCGLECQPKGELHGARPTLLILRGEGAEAGVEHLRGLPKLRVGVVGIDVAEVGVVEEIEGLGPEVEYEIVSQREVAP